MNQKTTIYVKRFTYFQLEQQLRNCNNHHHHRNWNNHHHQNGLERLSRIPSMENLMANLSINKIYANTFNGQNRADDSEINPAKPDTENLPMAIFIPT